jgi:hypothetical protein
MVIMKYVLLILAIIQIVTDEFKRCSEKGIYF